MASTSIRYLLRQRRTVHDVPIASAPQVPPRAIALSWALRRLVRSPKRRFGSTKAPATQDRRLLRTRMCHSNMWAGGRRARASAGSSQHRPCTMEPSNVTHARQLHMKAPKIGMRTSIRSSNAPASDSILIGDAIEPNPSTLGLEAAVHDGHATGLNPWTRSRRTRRSRCWAQSGTVPVRRQKHFVRR